MLKLLYRSVSIGGAQTLLYRIAHYCHENHLQVALYCSSLSAKMQKLFENNCTAVYISEKPHKDIISDASGGDIVLTLMLDDFIECELYAKKRKNVKVLCYVVHHDGFKFGIQYTLLDNLFKYLFRKQICKYIENGNVLFMEESDYKDTIQYYNIYPLLHSDIICRLPVSEPTIDEEYFATKTITRQSGFKVLTIARADFPFKGYIKGLVEMIDEMIIEGFNIKLLIVSSGEQICSIKRWMSDLINYNCFELLHDVPYSKLENLYHDAHLYIGMGTTVLEASASAVPSIHVSSYTYEIKAQDFFYNLPFIVKGDEGTSLIAKNLITKIYSISDEQYKEMCRFSCEIIKKYFSMECLMNKILTFSPKENIHYIREFIRIRGLLIHVKHKLHRIIKI